MDRLTRSRTAMFIAAAAGIVLLLFAFSLLNSNAVNMGVFGLFGLSAILLYVAFWAAIIVGGIWLARELGLLKGLGGDGSAASSGDDPLAILDRRYANGEISRSEYFQVKQDLESGR